MLSVRRLYALVAFVLVVLAASFIVTQWLGSGSGSHAGSLRVGYLPIMDCAQLFAAEAKDEFRKTGLNVELIPMTGGALTLQALATGDLDVAFANLTSVVLFEELQPLSPLSGGTRIDAEHSEGALVVLETSSVRSLSDLQGKRVAVNTQKNIVALGVARALRLSGVNMTETVLVEVPFKDMEVALRAGHIDAASLPEPILSRALNAGGLRSLGDHFLLAFGPVSTTGFFTAPETLKKHPSDFARFNEAIERVTPLVNDLDPTVVAGIAKRTGTPEETIRKAGRPAFITTLPRDAIDQMRQWMREEGYLGK